jgi:peptidoglycan-associated lipoprotein
MRILKIIVCLIMMAAVLNGCFKKKRGDGSLVGTDTPLEAFPLDSFSEAAGSDADVLKNIYFDYNKYNIKANEEEIINSIANWLRDKPKTHLLIEGHCDERGSNEYNMALGEQRALAVRQFIVDKGIPAGRLQTISYGEEKPVEKGHDEAAWSKNRRAHFLVAEEK